MIGNYKYLSIILFIVIISSPITANADTNTIWSKEFSTDSKITYEVNNNNEQTGYLVYKYGTVNIDTNVVSFTITNPNGIQSTVQIDISSGKIKDSTKESFIMKDVSKFSISSSLSYNILGFSDHDYQITSQSNLDCISIINKTNILVSLPVWELSFDQSNTTVSIHDVIFLSQITGTLLYRNYTEVLKSSNSVRSEYLRIFSYTGITLTYEHYLQSTVKTTVKLGNTPGFEFFSILIFVLVTLYTRRRKKD